MKVLVINYTDWIGYHFVEGLLGKGYTVKGEAADKGNEILADFFARNSNFSIFNKQEEDTFDFAVCIGDDKAIDELKAERILLINSNREIEEERVISIRTGKLFGEWMPMDEEGFSHKGKKVLFSSDRFKEEGIYIADFVNKVLGLLEDPIESRDVCMKAARSLQNQTEKLDNFFLVNENNPIEEDLQQVIEHYQKFHVLYPNVE